MYGRRRTIRFPLSFCLQRQGDCVKWLIEGADHRVIYFQDDQSEAATIYELAGLMNFLWEELEKSSAPKPSRRRRQAGDADARH